MGDRARELAQVLTDRIVKTAHAQGIVLSPPGVKEMFVVYLRDYGKEIVASAESDLLKRMMKPSHALIVAVNNLSLDSDDDGRRLNIGIWLEGHHAMLRAFAKENNIGLEVE